MRIIPSINPFSSFLEVKMKVFVERFSLEINKFIINIEIETLR